MKKLYFAYGSNMLHERLEARIGKVAVLGTYAVPGWRLMFNAGSYKKAFANMVATGRFRDEVRGVVYEMTSRQMKALDGFEGHPILYTRTVVGSYKGKDLFAYIAFNPEYSRQDIAKVSPEKEYLQVCAAGADQNGLDILARTIRTYCIMSDIYDPKVVGVFR